MTHGFQEHVRELKTPLPLIHEEVGVRRRLAPTNSKLGFSLGTRASPPYHD